MRFILLMLVLLICTTSCSNHCPLLKGEFVDLTYNFSSETVYWPSGKPFVLEKEFEGFTNKGYYYSAYKYSASEHGGTHIDAPIHFAKGGNTVDRIHIEQLIGEGIVINVEDKAKGNIDYEITTSNIIEWELKHGKIPKDVILFFYTGHSKHWPNRLKYLGTEKMGIEGINELHFPGLHKDAANWLVKNRKIKAIGLDTPSIDYGQSRNFECHQILLGSNIVIFENVANLEKLSSKGFHIIALPMKIKDGSGAPLRIVAIQ